MTILHIYCASIIYAFTALSLQAMEYVRVLDYSKSQNLLRLNIGEYDGIHSSEHAQFFLKTPVGDGAMLGVARCVKVYTNHSLWFFVERPARIGKVARGSLLAILPMEQTMANLGNPPVESGDLVYLKSELKDLEQLDSPLPEHLVGNDGSFVKKRKLVDKGGRKNLYTSVGAANWQKGHLGFMDEHGNGFTEYFVKTLQKAISKERFIGEIRREQFDKLTEAFIDDANESEFDVDKFLAEDVSVEDIGFVREDDIQNPGDHFRIMRAKREILRKKILSEAENKESWSEKMTDEELYKVVMDLDLAEEKKRRREIMGNYLGQHFFASLRLPANLSKDRTGRYGMSIGYEYPLQKVLRNWRDFSLILGFEQVREFFIRPEIEVRSRETGVMFALRYYLRHYPSILRRMLWFGSLTTRLGQAALENTRSFSFQNYNFYSFAGLEFGCAYRVTKNLGVQATVLRERLRFKADTEKGLRFSFFRRESVIRTSFTMGIQYVY